MQTEILLPIVARTSSLWQTVPMGAMATVEILRSLTKKIAGEKPDLRAATGVVNDLGRHMAVSRTDDVRLLQSEIASLREQLALCEDVAELKPAEILRGRHGRIFLAGAMWSADEMVSSHAAALEFRTEETSFGTLRATIAQRAVELLQKGPTTPTAIRQHLEREGVPARPDQVSKSLGELIARGVIAPDVPPEGSDRRARFYRLVEQGR